MSGSQGTITLGIEMSNPSAGADGAAAAHAVAMWDAGGALLGSAPLAESRRGADSVLHAVSELARACSVTPGDIGRIVVSVGPGGYTALRIATTSAKVLADTLGAELIAVPTARVASVGVTATLRPALIVLASKKERGHATLLGSDGSLRALGVVGAEALGEHGARAVVADRHLPGSFRERAVVLGIEVAPIRLDARDLLAASDGLEAVDPLRLAPEYAREPDAVTQWRARGSG